MSRYLLPLIVLLLAPAGLGCTPPPRLDGAPPSINDRYRDPKLEVASWTKRFEGESREVYRERLRVVSALDLKPGMTVADVGSGTGLFVAYLAKAVGPTGRVIGVDIVPKFVAFIEERARKAGFRNVTAQLGGQSDVRLKAGSVDLVFICDTYHHFEKPAAILATIRAALKPGGRLVVVDYHRIEGRSRPFIMGHVRAGKETFAAEIAAAGFKRLPDPKTPWLYENYMIAFRR